MNDAPPKRNIWRANHAGFSTRVTTALRGQATLRWLIYACVFENCVLSLINNFFLTVNTTVVIATQLTITIFSILVVIVRKPKISEDFAKGCLIVGALVIIIAIFNGGFQPRFLYDVALIPIFILLGSTAEKPDLSIFVNLVIIIFGIALLELCFSDTYLAIFNPRKYFNATRDWVVISEQVSRLDSTLYGKADYYQGSMRGAGGTYFGSSHRLGSTFLEPLGLAYFAVISCMFFIQAHNIVRWKRVLLVAICFVLAGLSDTRTAVFMIAVMIVAQPVLKKLPRDFLLFLPIFIVISGYSYYIINLGSTGDTEQRLSLTYVVISESSIFHLIFGGMSQDLVKLTYGDSGIIYLVNNVGILGYVAFVWVASGIFNGNKVPVFIIASSITYIVVQSLFGEAFLSIKTAALLGYGIGAIGNSTGTSYLPKASRVKPGIKMRFPRTALQSAAPRYPD